MPHRMNRLSALERRLGGESSQDPGKDPGKDPTRKRDRSGNLVGPEASNTNLQNAETLRQQLLQFGKMSVEERREMVLQAAYEGDTKKLDAVLRSGDLGPSPKALMGQALHAAVEGAPKSGAGMAGSRAVVSLLTKAGADLETRNSLGETPLHVAAHRGQTGICKTLLVAGSNPAAETPLGKTPADHADSSGYPGVRNMIVRSAIESGRIREDRMLRMLDRLPKPVRKEFFQKYPSELSRVRKFGRLDKLGEKLDSRETQTTQKTQKTKGNPPMSIFKSRHDSEPDSDLGPKGKSRGLAVFAPFAVFAVSACSGVDGRQTIGVPLAEDRYLTYEGTIVEPELFLPGSKVQIRGETITLAEGSQQDFPILLQPDLEAGKGFSHSLSLGNSDVLMVDVLPGRETAGYHYIWTDGPEIESGPIPEEKQWTELDLRPVKPVSVPVAERKQALDLHNLPVKVKVNQNSGDLACGGGNSVAKFPQETLYPVCGTPIVRIARRGDTWWGFSRKTGIPFQDLAKMNATDIRSVQAILDGHLRVGEEMYAVSRIESLVFPVKSSPPQARSPKPVKSDPEPSVIAVAKTAPESSEILETSQISQISSISESESESEIAAVTDRSAVNVESGLEPRETPETAHQPDGLDAVAKPVDQSVVGSAVSLEPREEPREEPGTVRQLDERNAVVKPEIETSVESDSSPIESVSFANPAISQEIPQEIPLSIQQEQVPDGTRIRMNSGDARNGGVRIPEGYELWLEWIDGKQQMVVRRSVLVQPKP